MKNNLLFIIVCFTLSFSSFSNIKNNSILFNDSIIKDSSLLRNFAYNFKANQLNLSNSIIENADLNKFLTINKKDDIKVKPDFEYFVVLLILKQYELHITKYHQGFDLYSMRIGNGTFIVDSFLDISNKSNLEKKWLNSSYILEFIAANEKYSADSVISEIVTRINNLPKK
jgi:hypothetical protein